MPTNISPSPSTSRWCRFFRAGSPPILGMPPAHDEEDAHVERQRHERQQRHGAQRPPAVLRQLSLVLHIGHGGHLSAAQSSWYGCAHTAVGGVSKLWYGGG